MNGVSCTKTKSRREAFLEEMEQVVLVRITTGTIVDTTRYLHGTHIDQELRA